MRGQYRSIGVLTPVIAGYPRTAPARRQAWKTSCAYRLLPLWEATTLSRRPSRSNTQSLSQANGRSITRVQKVARISVVPSQRPERVSRRDEANTHPAQGQRLSLSVQVQQNPQFLSRVCFVRKRMKKIQKNHRRAFVKFSSIFPRIEVHFGAHSATAARLLGTCCSRVSCRLSNFSRSEYGVWT